MNQPMRHSILFRISLVLISLAGHAGIARADSLYDQIIAQIHVVAAQQVYDLRHADRNLAERHLMAAQDRFDVGEVQRTDVEALKAQRAMALIFEIEAKLELDSAMAIYNSIVPALPAEFTFPSPREDVPATLDEALSMAPAKDSLKIELAWRKWHAAISLPEIYEVRVNAAQIIFDGVREDAQVGAKRFSDVIAAERELLEAEVEHTLAVASSHRSTLDVLFALGLLEKAYGAD
jgi:outer membrane protein TolC